MEKYNFFIEAVQSFGGSRADIAAFWFCGLPPGESDVEIWKISQGKASHMIKPLGAEYNGTATRGWKRGSPGKPVSIIKGK